MSHFHSTAACQLCVFLRVQRSRTQRCSGFRTHALRVKHRHVKFAVRCFDHRRSCFRVQRADRYICLCGNRSITCGSGKRSRVYAACFGRNSKRRRFRFGERDIAVSLDGRAVLCGELLEQEHAMGRDLRLSFFGRHLAAGNRRPFAIGIGEIAARGIRAVLDSSFICDPHRFRGIRTRRQLAAVRHGHSAIRGIAAIGECTSVGDTHRRAGHRRFCHCRISVSVIREPTACGESSVLDGLAVRDAHRPCFCGVCPRRQLAAVFDGHRTARGIAAVGERARVGDVHRRTGHRCFSHCRISVSVIRERTACGESSVLDGLAVCDAHRPRFCGVCPRRQLAAVFDGHRTSLCSIAAIGDVHRSLRGVRAGRQLAEVCDGHRSRLCGIAAVLDGSFIGEGDRTASQRDVFHDTVFAMVIDNSSAARKYRILNGCGIRDVECLCPLYLRTAETCLICQGGLCACEGATSDGVASDGAIIRIINVEGFSCLVAAIRDLAVVGDGGIFRFDGSLIRCRFSEECDVGIARRLETDAARHRTAVFRFCSRHFHAEGLSFALALDICHVFDGNILTFHIRVGGAHFFICIMAVFSKEAVALEVKYHVPIGRVDGMDDEVAVFRKRDAFLCAGGEGAAFLDGDAGDLSFAGFKNDLVLRTHGDIVEVARPLHAELAAREEVAPFLHAGIAGEVDDAIFCFGDEFPVRICRDRADGADGDGLAVYFEIPSLCGREGDQLVCRQALDLLFRREVDHLSVFLVSDAARVLAGLAALRCQGDILPRGMRGFFLRGLGISNALFDAAAGIGNEEILRGLRRADEDFFLFFYGEVLIRCQIFFGERGIAVEHLVRAVLDPLHIRFDVRFLPSADGLSELIVARLFLSYIRIDVSDALLRKCRLRGVVQSVRPVFDVGRKGLILIVFTLYFGDEEGLLF